MNLLAWRWTFSGPSPLMCEDSIMHLGVQSFDLFCVLFGGAENIPRGMHALALHICCQAILLASSHPPVDAHTHNHPGLPHLRGSQKSVGFSPSRGFHAHKSREPIKSDQGLSNSLYSLRAQCRCDEDIFARFCANIACMHGHVSLHPQRCANLMTHHVDRSKQ